MNTMSVEKKNIVRALVADMAKEGRKDYGRCFKLAIAIYELVLDGDIPANWEEGFKAIREEFLPEAPKKEDKATRAAFIADMQQWRRAAAVGIALGKLRPNSEPFGLKTQVVQLPPVISGKELAETFCVTNAGKLCMRWLSDKKVAEPVDQVKSAMVRLIKVLNDAESISDAAYDEYTNLVAAMMVHKNRRELINAAKPHLIKAAK